MTLDLATILPALSTLAALAPVARYLYRRMAGMSRTITALERAVELHDAQSRGVVLLVTVPSAARPCAPLLRESGWTVAPYELRDGEGVLPDTAQFRADCAAADVVVLAGHDVGQNAAVARTRWFRDALGPGHAVISYAPSAGVRYDQALWGDGDQSVTTPATCEAAVRSAVARRRIVQRLQGVRPGGLAAAKAALPGASGKSTTDMAPRQFVGDDMGEQV